MKENYENMCSKYKLRPIRLAIPSKGRMKRESIQFLENCGFTIQVKERQYLGYLLGPCNIQLVFQRHEDILYGIESGSVDLGIVGKDIYEEKSVKEDYKNLIIIHDSLQFGNCRLELAVPEDWNVDSLRELKQRKKEITVATKFPGLTMQYLDQNRVNYRIIKGNGSIEVFPALNHSDIIVDLVSTGQTLNKNRLKMIKDGTILKSEAILIGNSKALKDSQLLNITKDLLEFFEATLRAEGFFSVFVNIRGENEEIIANSIYSKEFLKGLQGPTISPVITKNGEKMFAIHIIVKKMNLQEAIKNLREIGGSGVVVLPTVYIFEEEPHRYQLLLKKIGEKNG
jgi:ATP phosphoribosyltransferase